MNNPFEKKDDGRATTIAAIIGAIAFGTIAGLYLIKNGSGAPKSKKASLEEEERANEHFRLHWPKKRQRTNGIHQLENQV